MDKEEMGVSEEVNWLTVVIGGGLCALPLIVIMVLVAREFLERMP